MTSQSDKPAAPPATSTTPTAQAAQAAPTPPVPRTRAVPNARTATLPKAEHEGVIYFQRLLTHLTTQKASFFCEDNENSPRILLHNQLISLDFDVDNYALADLLQKVCHVTTLSPGARAGIQRLAVHTLNTAGSLKLRQFSAKVGKELFLPTNNRKELLSISSDGVRLVPNGDNSDHVWVEHPKSGGIRYRKLSEGELKDALGKFESLCVLTQATEFPELQWFVAMAEGLFPYVREMCQNRFIVAHTGPSQSGKTSGAQRFVNLHGLGQVKGDCSIAGLRVTGDCGLLVLDNKETRNFHHDLVDFLLFVSTGSEALRATKDGKHLVQLSNRRPAGVITTIEGVYTDELQRRIVTVPYATQPGRTALSRSVEEKIDSQRHEILSALVIVLERAYSVWTESLDHGGNCPIVGFEDHYLLLCDLLTAYGDVTGRPREWSAQIIQIWAKSFRNELEDNELEAPIMNVVTSHWEDEDWKVAVCNYRKIKGKLYVVEPRVLLRLLQQYYGRFLAIPKTAWALSRRLRSNQFQAFFVLDEKNAPEIKDLRRTQYTRYLGIFIPDPDSPTN